MNVLTVNLYKAGVTTKFVKYEDLDDNDKLSVYPQPVFDTDCNLCMEVEWLTKDGTGGGSGFKYMLVTQDSLKRLASNFVTGWECEPNTITVVRVIGDVAWAVSLASPEDKGSMPFIGSKGHDELAQWLVDNLVELAQDQGIVKVNHH